MASSRGRDSWIFGRQSAAHVACAPDFTKAKRNEYRIGRHQRRRPGRDQRPSPLPLRFQCMARFPRHRDGGTAICLLITLGNGK